MLLTTNCPTIRHWTWMNLKMTTTQVITKHSLIMIYLTHTHPRHGLRLQIHLIPQIPHLLTPLVPQRCRLTTPSQTSRTQMKNALLG